jgi:hypothetical protein
MAQFKVIKVSKIVSVGYVEAKDRDEALEFGVSCCVLEDNPDFIIDNIEDTVEVETVSITDEE